MQNEPFALVGESTDDVSASSDLKGPVSAIEQLLSDGGESQQLGDDPGQAGEEVIPQVGESEDPIDDVSPDAGLEEQDDELFVVTIDGEEQEVTLDELQAGYRRHADYTRKTQQLAEERNQFQQETQQSQQEREQYKHLVSALGDKLKSMTGDEPDWQKIAAEDPAGYVQQKAAWDHRQSQIQAADQESDRLRQEDIGHQQQNYQQYMAQQRTALLNARPELSEPDKAQAFFGNINNYARQEYGFTDQELSTVLDHRFLLMAEKARQFDELQATGKPVAKKVKRRAPLKPGVRKRDPSAASTANRNAQKRLERTGSTRDAAALIEGMLD